MRPTAFPHWATWQQLSGVVRGGMHATTRPFTAWQGWVAAHAERTDRNSRRRMLSLSDLADLRDIKVDFSRLPRPEITFYTPNQIRHLIRFEGPLSRALPTSGGWEPAQPRDPPTNWRLADITHIQLPPPARASPAPAPPTHAWLEGAARGLPLGAIVLVLLVLIARVADKCLDSGFFRRRRSVEWSAANVTATNADANAPPGDLPHNELDAFDPECPASSAPDLPPPYSECTRTNTVNLPGKHDDPPPPYSSACHVSFSHPKDRLPTVHFYKNFISTGASSAPLHSPNPNTDLHIYGFDLDTGQTPSSESSTGCDDRRGLVFENGRVVERGPQANDDNGNANANGADSNINGGNRGRNSRGGGFIA